MNRRGFLGAILAACAAPAIVRADALMRIVPIDTTILLPEHFKLYGGAAGAGKSWARLLQARTHDRLLSGEFGGDPIAEVVTTELCDESINVQLLIKDPAYFARLLRASKRTSASWSIYAKPQ